jgi:hypothetical protein
LLGLDQPANAADDDLGAHDFIFNIHALGAIPGDPGFTFVRCQITRSRNQVGQSDLPFLVTFNPPDQLDVGVELDLVDNLVLLADLCQVLGDFRAGRMQRGPILLGAERERVENRRTATVSAYSTCRLKRSGPGYISHAAPG